MESENIGPWHVEYDAGATRRAYAAVARSGPDECSCVGCKNWLKVREIAYPFEFLELLDRFGIDPMKESEVYDIAAVPVRPGVHYYGGWFHFFGRVSRLSDSGKEVNVSNGFSYGFDSSYAPGPKVFTSSTDSCRIEFRAEAPWVVAEPEPRLEEMPRRPAYILKPDKTTN